MATTELAVIDQFMDRALAAKQTWIDAVNSSDSLRIAFAESRAKRLLLESLTDAVVSAELLAFCSPELAMTEIIGQVQDRDKVRITAMAILTGFAPGNDEYAIFGGKGAAKLYVKEQGYRVLFSRLSSCSSPDVKTGRPHVKPGHHTAGTVGADAQGGLVVGEASCVPYGVLHVVQCVGEWAVGIPGHATDNIDGIKAKARRRLLQLLWKKVSSAALGDSEDDYQQAEAVVMKPAVIEHRETPASDVWAAEAGRIEAPRAKDAWAALVQAANAKRIDEIMEGVKKIDATARDRESLERFAFHRLEEMSR